MRTAFRPAALAAGMMMLSTGAFAQSANPAGVWLTQSGDARVRIAQCGSALCGTIVWLKNAVDQETGRPPTDKRNPDPARRDTPIMGLQIMFGMMPSGADRWSGRFYHTEDGKVYAGNLVVTGPDTVKAEGCMIGICMGETWQRVEGPKPTAATKARRKG